jgi:hypothetical protein
MHVARLALLGFVVTACGDNVEREIAEQLDGLAGVTVVEWMPPDGFEPQPGYRYFDLTFEQPIDHDDPSKGTFLQYGALMHRSAEAPLVLYTSGYGAGWRRYLSEPAAILAANQLSLEYRFYGGSRGAADWSKLTVDQNARDEHAILGALGDIYHGATIQTGGSKGGENALFHLWRYPDDLDGVVAYVAPVITDFPDLRYATVLDDIGGNRPACRDALRAVQRELLLRRAGIEARASGEDAYAIAGVAHAVETAIVELEFSFWMTRGENHCYRVPAATASDSELYDFLVDTGGPAAYGDDDLIAYGQQYLWQDHLELGYPIWQHAHLDDLLTFSYEDWSAYLPAPVPVYDPSESRGLAEWLASGPDRVMFVGGQWDPWGAGYPVIPQDRDTLVFSVERGSHWSSGIYSTTLDERSIATSTLQRWAGVTGERAISFGADPRSPAVPDTASPARLCTESCDRRRRTHSSTASSGPR